VSIGVVGHPAYPPKEQRLTQTQLDDRARGAQVMPFNLDGGKKIDELGWAILVLTPSTSQ
jgi:hypothetical protein